MTKPTKPRAKVSFCDGNAEDYWESRFYAQVEITVARVKEREAAHARIAELEDRVQKLETCVLTLLPWAEDHEAELAPFEVKMLERARAVEKGK